MLFVRRAMAAQEGTDVIYEYDFQTTLFSVLKDCDKVFLYFWVPRY
jgi:hypothetical protein